MESRRETAGAARPVLTGVGVGPGDPRQVTLAALEAVRSAEVVIAPSTAPDALGRAEAVLRQVCPEIEVLRVAIPMTVETDRSGIYRGVAAEIARWLDAGRTVAFATIGDPNVYSTFTSVAEAVLGLRPDTGVETVPGIMAFQELAARSSTTLLDGRDTMILVAALDDDLAELQRALANPEATVVVYKGGRRFPEIAKRAAEAGRLVGAVTGELLGMPGERVSPLAEVAATPSTYLSTIIIPPRR